MKTELHTVLGASGAMGSAVVNELLSRELKVRAVQRTPSNNLPVTIPADLLKPSEALKAIKGSGYVYLCVALPYNSKSWQNWPVLMQNVLDACVVADANLIFLDNVYMYGPAPLQVPFDELHPQKPVSVKGQFRKKTADMLMEAISGKKVNALIGRSADFYGPKAIYSPFYFSFLERMLHGKSPQSLNKSGVRHTYAYTVDNARALVQLALEPSAYGQVWHLPAGEAITIGEITEMFSKILGTNHKTSFMPPLMRRMLSLFIPILKEVGEMMYQFDSEYVISWEKFKSKFPDFKVTTYEEGIREMVNSFRNH